MTWRFGIMFAVILPGRPTRADDGSLETVGGSVRLMLENANIRMVSEVVRARIDKEQGIEVDCLFVLRNEGPADTVLIGFPDGSLDEDYGGASLEDFRSWVDGTEVTCARVPDGGSLPEVDAPSWWVKRVHFARGATRRIRDHYRVGPAFESSTMTRSFVYVLATGASWKGPIGSAEITATLDGVPMEWVVETEPRARRAGCTFRWSFRDFEPGVNDESPGEVSLSWGDPEVRRRLEIPDPAGK